MTSRQLQSDETMILTFTVLHDDYEKALSDEAGLISHDVRVIQGFQQIDFIHG